MDETRTMNDPPEPLGPGLTIEGYEIVRELHRSGQGVVYEALQRSTKRKVAVKVLLAGVEEIPTSGREIRLREELDRIVKLYAAWHATAPDAGYDAKAAVWRAKLPQEQTSDRQNGES